MNIQERDETKQEALNILLEEIYLYLRYGEIEKALDALDEAIDENKNHYEYLVEKVKLLYMLYLKDEAYELLDANVELLYSNIDKINVDFISRRIYYHFYRNTELNTTSNSSNFDYLKITKEFINKYGFSEQEKPEISLQDKTIDSTIPEAKVVEAVDSGEPCVEGTDGQLFEETNLAEDEADGIQTTASDSNEVPESFVDEVNIFEDVVSEEIVMGNIEEPEALVEKPEQFEPEVAEDIEEIFAQEATTKVSEEFEPEIMAEEAAQAEAEIPVEKPEQFEAEVAEDPEETVTQEATIKVTEEFEVEVSVEEAEEPEPEIMAEEVAQSEPEVPEEKPGQFEPEVAEDPEETFAQEVAPKVAEELAPEISTEEPEQEPFSRENTEEQDEPVVEVLEDYEDIETISAEEVAREEKPIEEEDIVIEDNPHIDIPIYLGKVNGKDVFFESMAEHTATPKEEKPIVIIESSHYTFARLASLLILGFVIGAAIVYYL